MHRDYYRIPTVRLKHWSCSGCSRRLRELSEPEEFFGQQLPPASFDRRGLPHCPRCALMNLTGIRHYKYGEMVVTGPPAWTTAVRKAWRCEV